MEVEYRPEGRYITARDVAERLMPDLYIHEVMLWAPDLFAYTSYILTMTSAYQLVVSPPPGKRWQPDKSEISSWLLKNLSANLRLWLNHVQRDWDGGCKIDPKLIKKIVDEVRSKMRQFSLETSKSNSTTFWEALVQKTGEEWQEGLGQLTESECNLIDDTINVGKTVEELPESSLSYAKTQRERQLCQIVLKHCPPVLLACWAFFYRKAIDEKFHNDCKLQITELLCNQDYHRADPGYTEKLWNVAQAILTMHAIADIASVSFGVANDPSQFRKKQPALEFAESLLFGRCKGLYKNTMFFGGGSLSTFSTERVRILPKRHNPGVGITLRSISSNLAFHQSAVDIVWRKAKDNPLAKRLSTDPDKHTVEGLSVLLLPFPETVRTDEFEVRGERNWLNVSKAVTEEGHRYFSYEPKSKGTGHKMDKVLNLIEAAQSECPNGLDMVVFPEASLTVGEFEGLEDELIKSAKPPSILIAGVIETVDDLKKDHKKSKLNSDDLYFSRNAVYCKYYDSIGKTYYSEGKNTFLDRCPKGSPLLEKVVTPKFKQYKHHRWQLDRSQISRYGLSSRLEPDRLWWEAIKVPKRRVSFLNVGNRMTISHLICEDLARQDPIADLIRHVGPSLVVAILMDGPQLKNRWSARYATVLADDPGCSVITLTSFGMVKRDTSPYGSLSRVIGLWNDSSTKSLREIELASGARGVLLTLELVKKREKTADGRKEKYDTSVIRLQDIIQIYE